MQADVLPLTPPSQLSATTTKTGFQAIGVPANPGALTVLRQGATSKNYAVLSFNTDSSLATTVGH